MPSGLVAAVSAASVKTFLWMALSHTMGPQPDMDMLQVQLAWTSSHAAYAELWHGGSSSRKLSGQAISLLPRPSGPSLTAHCSWRGLTMSTLQRMASIGCRLMGSACATIMTYIVW